MENALTIRESQQSLEERKKQTDLMISTATYWATKLMQLVEQCNLARSMSGKKYLEVEGWQIIASFAHVSWVIEWTHDWRDEQGKLLGYTARCKLVDQDGKEVGSGESSCGLDAFPCRGKEGSEKDKAARSAAQTWAISRALRNKFSYIAKMAGYQPVPFEEMPHTQARPAWAPKKGGDRRSAKTILGEAVLGYTNSDKDAASKILQAITGKPSLYLLNEDEAKAAQLKFEAEYLHAGPPLEGEPDDDVSY